MRPTPPTRPAAPVTRMGSLSFEANFETLSLTIATFGLLNAIVVSAHVPTPHQAFIIEFPMLVAMSAVPLTLRIAPLLLEAHRDSISGEAPKLFHQAVVEFRLPFPLQERLDRFVPLEELR